MTQVSKQAGERRADEQAPRVREMLRGLVDPDAAVREAAARAFCSIREPRALGPLRQLLADTDAGVRIAASEALYNNGDRRGVGLLIGMLQETRAAQAAAALGRIGEAEAVPALIDAAGARDIRLRIEAVQSLGMIGDARATEALARIVRESGGSLRRAALRAIGQTGTRDPGVMREVTAILRSGDIATRIAAANALRICGNRDSLPALIDSFAYSVRGDDPDHAGADSPGVYGVRNEAVAALVDIVMREPGSVETVIAALGDRREDVRMNAAKALGRIGDARAVPALMRLLGTDRDDYVRMAAAEALGMIRDMRAVPALMERVGEEGTGLTSQRSIAAAAEALGRIGDARAVPALRDALSDGSEVIRMAAVTALGFIGDPSAIPAVSSIYQRDSFPALRAAAAIALGRIGGSDAEAALMRSTDDNPSVGAAVQRALGTLRSRR